MDRQKKRTEIEVTLLKGMLDAQKQLDKIAFENAGTTRRETLINRDIALFVEAGEMINEIGHIWKYWKKNHKTNWSDIREELADVLHFMLSRGNDLMVDAIHVHVIRYEHPEHQIKAFADSVMTAGESEMKWRKSFAIFRGLVGHLGITWDEMKDEYWSKHKKNRERQANNY